MSMHEHRRPPDRPRTPPITTAGPDLLTGGRGLLQDEPLIFELRGWDKTGVDLPEPSTTRSRPRRPGAHRADRPAGPLRARDDAPLRAPVSQKNHAIDLALYPLGSCTMKHNPRLNEKMARLPGFADIHPLQPLSTVQGALELMDRWPTG